MHFTESKFADTFIQRPIFDRVSKPTEKESPSPQGQDVFLELNWIIAGGKSNKIK